MTFPNRPFDEDCRNAPLMAICGREAAAGCKIWLWRVWAMETGARRCYLRRHGYSPAGAEGNEGTCTRTSTEEAYSGRGDGTSRAQSEGGGPQARGNVRRGGPSPRIGRR